MLVSIITSTCNRARFIPRLIQMVKSQTYPSAKIEWIVLDDGEPVKHLFEGLNVRYTHHGTKLPMGHKLNLLNKEAKGDIIIVFDDDDYYPPDRVSSVVEAFSKSKKEVAGTSLVNMYYTDTNEIYSTGDRKSTRLNSSH